MAGRDACAARASGVTLTASPARGAMRRKCCHDFLIAGIPKIVLGRLSGILQWARCAWSRAVHPKRQTAEAAETALEGACEAAGGLANAQGGGAEGEADGLCRKFEGKVHCIGQWVGPCLV
jgi:hypothetical protein